MNAKALIPLIVGLGIAGFAAKLGFDFVKNAEGKQGKVVKLWTPVEDINRGVAIDESMIRPLAFPQSAAPDGALADPKKIVGRVPHTGAPAGVPILDSMLLAPGAKAGVRVPPGLRAVAVKIDESSGVDNHLEPGCRVDVVGLFTVRRNNRADTIARTVVEDVEVAAVGQRIAPVNPAREEGQDSKSSKRERPARAVTLLVKPSQVPTLHLAEQRGAIKLAMRSTRDQGRDGEAAEAATDDLLGTADPQPESKTLAWNERFDAFVQSLWKRDDQAGAEPEMMPVPEPVPDKQQPRLAWVMAVYNGDERQLLGWTEFDHLRPIQLSSEGPNIFQNDSQPPPPGTGPGSLPGWEPPGQSQANPPLKAESQSQLEPASETDAESETKPEPEELFE